MLLVYSLICVINIVSIYFNLFTEQNININALRNARYIASSVTELTLFDI